MRYSGTSSKQTPPPPLHEQINKLRIYFELVPHKSSQQIICFKDVKEYEVLKSIKYLMSYKKFNT